MRANNEIGVSCHAKSIRNGLQRADLKAFVFNASDWQEPVPRVTAMH